IWRATSRDQSRDRPPEKEDTFPYQGEYIVEDRVIAGRNVPGKEIQRGCPFSPQQAKQARIANGEHRHMGAYPLVMQGAGRKVHEPGGDLCMLVPVFQARSEGIMDIAGE